MTSTITSDSITNEDLPTRWEIELEFVQSLANTQYLTYLAQSGYLNDPKFLNYLNYLNYWKDPNYSKHLVYPNCLHILTLLQNENFRKDILNIEVSNLIYKDMVDSWKEPLFKEEKKRERKSSPKKIDKSTSSSKSNINSGNKFNNDGIEMDVEKATPSNKDDKEIRVGDLKEEKEINNIKDDKMDIDS